LAPPVCSLTIPPRPPTSTPFPYTTLFRSVEQAAAAVARTTAWAARSLGAHRRADEQALFGIVQGGTFLDLREESVAGLVPLDFPDRKSTRLNSSHVAISYAVFCLKKKNMQ